MDWYYVGSGRERVGPVTEAELERLVREGTIATDTLVWHAGMADWQPYAQAKLAPAPTGEAVCSQCGRTFPQNDMIRYGDSWVCAECKPVFVQKLKEGAALPLEFAYGGFWIRVAAKIIDGVLLGVTNGIVQMLLFPLFFSRSARAAAGVAILGNFFALVIAGAYETLFLGKYGATLGKMACGLRVITSDGGKVSYARALGRHFAEYLSSLILGIGYLMVAFDDQKRALHDRICDTRVIRK
jgi:uncharacterized RDD family membrane protein YckC